MHSGPHLQGYDPKHAGSLRFLDFSVATRRLSLPREARQLFAYVPIACSGFTLSGGLAASILAFRGLREFTRVTAHRFALQGFDPPIARQRRLRRYMCHRHFTW